jgi:hypothetical protein
VNGRRGRHGRLVALILVSLGLHVLVIGTVGRLPRPDRPDVTAAAPLALRLQPAPAPAGKPIDTAAPARPPKPPATPRGAPAPTGAPAPVAFSPPAPAAVVEPVPAATSGPVRSAIVAVPLQMPGRYRVRMPPSATLDYALTRADGTQVPAQIAWTTDGKTYAMMVDGVTGPVTSRGSIGDTGVAPDESRMRLANGGEIAAAFTPDALVIGGHAYPNGIGSQDPASLLLQLTGMGLAAPEQLADVVMVYVATAEGPDVLQLEVEGDEELATPLGTIATRRLRQLVGAGQARLEVWLAPERRWLPVQLRMTAADGTVTTQTITRIGDAGGAGTD